MWTRPLCCEHILSEWWPFFVMIFVSDSSAPSPGRTLDHAVAVSPALSLAPSPFAPDGSP